MLALLIALATAAPVEGQVRVGRVPVVDARIDVYDAQGVPLGASTYTDERGRFTIDAPADSMLTATRWVRADTGGRSLISANDVPVSDARRITLEFVDMGGGPVRLVGSRADRIEEALKVVRKRRSEVEAVCAAVLDTDDRDAARQAATDNAPLLAVGYGSGFEGCALRRFGSTDDIAVAERLTHNLDAAAGPGGQPLWAGLASVSFAEWSLAHGDYTRARRAAGAAVTRLGGLTGAQAGTAVAEAARPPLARAYEVEGEAALALQDAGGAVSKFHQSLRVYKQTGDVAGMARSELGIARAELMRGRLDQSEEHLVAASVLPLDATHRAILAEVEQVLASARAERAAEAQAAQAAQAAEPPVEAETDADVPYEVDTP